MEPENKLEECGTIIQKVGGTSVMRDVQPMNGTEKIINKVFVYQLDKLYQRLFDFMCSLSTFH